MKNLYIRCSEETYQLANDLAKKESRSVTKQIIHLIHNEAERLGIEVEVKKPDWLEKISDVQTTAELSSDVKVVFKGLLEHHNRAFPKTNIPIV